MSRQAASSAFHKSKTLDNKYMLGDEIGKGAYGRVYKGLDLENGDFVAIKQVSLENIAQEDLNIIMQEIDLLKNLNHKNIVKYLGSLKTKTHLHIVLEYVENGSLANIIKPNKFGPFPESLVAVYIAQVLEGLVYLHEQGVIHRDIKGANILTTKEGLVKLADFGVATKLTEADVNTHSVVGTPYWMAPEVIEMSGVCAASDIWSVGCTVIELLTCVPPYYDLQPMPALFRIVQDEHPPIPDSLSPDITDFLRQCFKKDARQRPDAKTLLSHPWIRNSRRALQSSLRHSGTIRNISEDVAADAESSIGDNQSAGESLPLEKVEASEMSSRKELLSAEVTDRSKYDHDHDHSADNNLLEERINNLDDDLPSDQVPTLAIHEKSSLHSSLGRLPVKNGVDDLGSAQLHEMSHQDEVMLNGDVGSPESRRKHLEKRHGGKGSSIDTENKSFGFGPITQDASLHKAVEFSRLVGSLRPEESEDAIVTASQKLVAIFHQRPEQKIVFVTQHGLLPLMDLLDVPRTRVICSVLQLINQIVKDNTDFQKNACLVGLIPLVMSFAGPDRPREIRMEAACFLQQLCQSSSLTLQMFIACCGIPVLVGFLEADYAKYREMVHLAIDGMWQVFKLQRSTPRNDFCRIAAKNGILLRLINTLYSLNEATRLATISVVGGFSVDGSAQRQRSGPLDSNHPLFAQNETPLSLTDQSDVHKVRHGITEHSFPTVAQEPSRASTSHSQRSDTNLPDSRYLAVDSDRPQSSNGALDVSVGTKLADLTSLEKVTNIATKESSTFSKERENLDRWKLDHARAEIDLIQQKISNSVSRTSTDRPPKSIEGMSNGFPTSITTQAEQVRPLLSLLEKEPPSRHFSGQLEYVRHLSGFERHESILPLLHANDRKTNGELDFLMAEFAEVSGRGRENGIVESTPRIPHKTVNKKVGQLAFNEGAASTSGIASRTASGVLSGSGVLNARPGSAASSGLLSNMVSTMNADVAREYLEKVADLLLEFAQADTTVKSYMCSQSLLNRLFQMFNRIEPPILLKILKCINHLSTDPNCLENLQRADAIKYLIPNLELKDGPLVSQIHHEVLNALFNLCKINKRRQEQAAENGIIPHLMNFIVSDSPLRPHALPLLCDMAHASRNSREQLRAHGGLDVYLSLLDDELWSVTALDSIAVCLAHDNDNRKVEQALLKKEAVQRLVKFFQCCPEQHFVHILEPFLKIITKSSQINTTLAVTGLTPLLISRLDHQDAIARLNLLKLIKAVYEHHPRPKQLIVENDLPQKLQNLIEERRDGQRSGGQVLVKQMATSLLKALHINTVL
ncbi:MAP3K epsilon protein kinase 1-like isoform X4 [Durio zibethinus]|uniref:non-specific serine/threonine protein kinase n=1 Tax=Durio zibethinus TaxID=66656 RepID=A0A6P6AGE8_DURZI|nr:MAP3K epsilon protein kinase 1-like isoform X4 [Durio zibethinus]